VRFNVGETEQAAISVLPNLSVSHCLGKLPVRIDKLKSGQSRSSCGSCWVK
jgi:hypothetical protein